MKNNCPEADAKFRVRSGPPVRSRQGPSNRSGVPVFRTNWSTRGGDGDKGKVTSGFIGNLRFSELTPRRQLLQTGVTETGGAELIGAVHIRIRVYRTGGGFPAGWA